MRKKLFLCFTFFCGWSCVCVILSLQNVNVFKKKIRLPKLNKCERAHPVVEGGFDPNACSWMFESLQVLKKSSTLLFWCISKLYFNLFLLKLKGYEFKCVTCEQVKEYPGYANENLKCNEARILDNINVPTKYCIVRAINESTQTLKKHYEFVYQSKCKGDDNCKQLFPDTTFTNCASDGVCEDDYGLDA